MAFGASVVKKTVFGDGRVVMLSCTADAAEGVLTTGLKNVVQILGFAPKSMSTGANGGAKMFINVGSTSTANIGAVAVSGVTSGDVFFLTVYGT